jgi:dephospho-CoA kinase
MLAVGLTGGIGSGKSTVADMLAGRGAVVIDADEIAREVVEPGAPAYQALVEHFGPGIVSAQGTIDRKALAALAFGEADALQALNAITHPVIGAVMAQRRQAQEGTANVVLLAIPLLRPAHRELLGMDVVVVVDCPVDVAIERLVTQRGFEPQDAAARVAAQVSREERRAGADFVIDNGGTLDALESQVGELWSTLQKIAR